MDCNPLLPTPQTKKRGPESRDEGDEGHGFPESKRPSPPSNQGASAPTRLTTKKPWSAKKRRQLTIDVKNAAEEASANSASFEGRVLVRSDVPWSEFNLLLDRTNVIRKVKLALLDGQILILDVIGRQPVGMITDKLMVLVVGPGNASVGGNCDDGPLVPFGRHTMQYTADSGLTPDKSFGVLRALIGDAKDDPSIMVEVVNSESFSSLAQRVKVYLSSPAVRMLIILKLCFAAEGAGQVTQMYAISWFKTAEDDVCTTCLCLGPTVTEDHQKLITNHFGELPFTGLGPTDGFDSVDQYAAYIRDHSKDFQLIIPLCVLNHGVPAEHHVHKDMEVPLDPLVEQLRTHGRLAF